MNLDELEAYVVARLGAGIAADDVILDLTQRSSLTRPEAEDLVRRTADLHGPTVARRPFPLMVMVSAAVLLGGAAVLAACGLWFADALRLLSPARGLTDQDRLAALLALIAAHSPMVGPIALGMAMILGGALGLARALRASWPTD